MPSLRELGLAPNNGSRAAVFTDRSPQEELSPRRQRSVRRFAEPVQFIDG
jgi:hypothetical protein